MSAIEDLKNIEIQHFAVYCLIFLSIMAPGLLIIYLFKIQIFLSFGVLKLMLFSIALSLPIPTLNTFISGTIDKDDGADVDNHVLLNIIFSFVGLYAAILIAYLWGLTFKELLITIGVLETIYITALFYTERIKK